MMDGVRLLDQLLSICFRNTASIARKAHIFNKCTKHIVRLASQAERDHYTERLARGIGISTATAKRFLYSKARG